MRHDEPSPKSVSEVEQEVYHGSLEKCRPSVEPISSQLIRKRTYSISLWKCTSTYYECQSSGMDTHHSRWYYYLVVKSDSFIITGSQLLVHYHSPNSSKKSISSSLEAQPNSSVLKYHTP